MASLRKETPPFTSGSLHRILTGNYVGSCRRLTVIVQEAGGVVTDIHGQPLDFSGGRRLNSVGVIASNGQFHHRIIEAVHRVRSRSEGK